MEGEGGMREEEKEGAIFSNPSEVVEQSSMYVMREAHTTRRYAQISSPQWVGFTWSEGNGAKTWSRGGGRSSPGGRR